MIAQKIKSEVIEAFWFRPMMIALMGFAAAELIIRVDMGYEVSTFLSAYGGLSADGARGILTAIAGSIIGVAATSFSITMSVLATASSTYGPRLVRNFMKDKRNQVTLGSFSAVFLYSLWILRYVRGEESPQPFIPQLGIYIAVLLAVAAVATLIYFIHHIADTIQVSTMLTSVKNDIDSSIQSLDNALKLKEFTRSKVSSTFLPQKHYQSKLEGYISSIDYQTIASLAKQNESKIKLLVEPGDYIYSGAIIAVSSSELDGEKSISSYLSVSDMRSPYHDVRFALQQPVDVALRAMSPGVNDPFTAINAIDILEPKLISILMRDDWDIHTFRCGDNVEFSVEKTSKLSLLRFVINSLAPVSSKDANMKKRFEKLIDSIASQTQISRKSLKKMTEEQFNSGQNDE